MVDRQALSIGQASDREAALALLQPAAEVAGIGVADMVDGCALFELREPGGRIVGAFAVRVDDYSTGRELTVTAAGASTASGAAEAMAAWAEQQARERVKARTLSCTTRRRGLMRKLQRLGYECTGYVMTKRIE